MSKKEIKYSPYEHAGRKGLEGVPERLCLHFNPILIWESFRENKSDKILLKFQRTLKRNKKNLFDLKI